MSRRKSSANMRNLTWESTQSIGGKFAKICETMMKSMAWKDLTMRQRGLYLELKIKYTKKSDGSDNSEDISITEKEYKNEYKNKNTLFKDVDALINNGFIRVINHGKYARRPNIYGFSDKWKNYNTPEYFIHPNEKRLTKTNTYQ